MKDRGVTERDFRKEEFKYADPEDYEFRGDGQIVRKDRWEKGIRSIYSLLSGTGAGEFEIVNLVEAIEWLLEQIPNRECEFLGEKNICKCPEDCDYQQNKTGSKYTRCTFFNF